MVNRPLAVASFVCAFFGAHTQRQSSFSLLSDSTEFVCRARSLFRCLSCFLVPASCCSAAPAPVWHGVETDAHVKSTRSL